MASIGVVASFLSDEKRKLSTTNSDAEDIQSRRPSIVIKPFPQYPPKWMNSGRDSNASKDVTTLRGLACLRHCFGCCFGCICLFCGCWRCGNQTGATNTK